MITPFLPGDSLIFMTAAIIATGKGIPAPLVIILFCAAAISGDTVNYQIGSLLRRKLSTHEHIPLINIKHVHKTQEFFEKHGGKTITIARFIPIIRTFAPFVAGAGKMKYRYFLLYNVIGAIIWVGLMFSIGYFFGNINIVRNNFSMFVIAIIVISLIPALVMFIYNKVQKKSIVKYAGHIQ